jgi:hypothetical protein
MIGNIKIHNIIDIIEISKSMTPYRCIHTKIMKMFPMIYQSSMGLKKSRCDIPNDTTQGWACPFSLLQ